MKFNSKKSIFIFIVACLSILFLLFFKDIKRKIAGYIHYFYNQNVKNSTCPNCANLFDDGVSKHKTAYQFEGIQPQKLDKDLTKLLKRGILLEIKSTDVLHVDFMPHSKPFLLPKSRNFILHLSEEYDKRCKSNGLKTIPIHLTSGTRSIDGVKRLQKNNQNSIEDSPHLRGKTFDISYSQFGLNGKPHLKLLVNLLYTYKRQKKCFVKFEKKQNCLHITVN